MLHKGHYCQSHAFIGGAVGTMIYKTTMPRSFEIPGTLYIKVYSGTLSMLIQVLTICCNSIHDDVITFKYFPRYWSFVREIHRSPVNSPHKGQWRGALMFSLICAWISGWVNNREAGDLRRYCAHYDVIVMTWPSDSYKAFTQSMTTPQNYNVLRKHVFVLTYDPMEVNTLRPRRNGR